MKKTIYLVVIVSGIILAVSSLYNSPLSVIMGYDYWDDLKIIGSYSGTVIASIAFGMLVIDRSRPTNEVIAEVVKAVVTKEMKDLTAKVIAEIKKNRDFQQVQPLRQTTPPGGN